jgi:pantetheine-phosphate adenylyltransferase
MTSLDDLNLGPTPTLHPGRTALVPGTYDPVTLGHVDVIRRAAVLFDRLVVAVVRAPQHKLPSFTVEERIGFLRDSLTDLENVVVAGFSSLVVEYAREWGATALVKGLRAVSDYEWEFQMGHLNKRLAPEIETVYLMSSPQYSFLSSSGVREIAAFGGALDELVPPSVARAFAERSGRLASGGGVPKE